MGISVRAFIERGTEIWGVGHWGAQGPRKVWEEGLCAYSCDRPQYGLWPPLGPAGTLPPCGGLWRGPPHHLPSGDPHYSVSRSPGLSRLGLSLFLCKTWAAPGSAPGSQGSSLIAQFRVHGLETQDTQWRLITPGTSPAPVGFTEVLRTRLALLGLQGVGQGTDFKLPSA